MSKEQLEAIRTAILKAAPTLTDDIASSRQGFDRASAAMEPAADITLSPAVIGSMDGLWVDAPVSQGKRVLLYLHGGAYVLGNAHGYRAMAGELARSSRARVLAINYRLAPENPFPAAVEDGVAAYRHLLDSGFPPGCIAIAGDSAGGGLALGVLLAIRDAGLPMPVCGAVISPWADLTCSSPSMESRAATDFILTASRLRSRAAAYLGGGSAEHPHVSPTFADFTGLPPLLIQVGEAEILLDEAIAVADRAAHSGVRVTLEVWPGMPHVWHRFLAVLDEAREGLEGIGAFINARFASGSRD